MVTRVSSGQSNLSGNAISVLKDTGGQGSVGHGKARADAEPQASGLRMAGLPLCLLLKPLEGAWNLSAQVTL